MIKHLNNTKYEEAKKWFRNHPKILVALSGGVDSCLAAFMGRHFLGKPNLIAVIGDSPALKRRDLHQAKDFCITHDINYQVIVPGEIDDPRYNSNPEDRCFWCKNSLYTGMKKLKEEQFPDHTIINGSNKSDLGDYRPGLKAADQYQVLSPLADCGFEKEDIREIASYFNLKEWNKPASPCLSSRFPYGESISIEKLKMVERAEALINSHGFVDVRARYRGGQVSIEVPSEEVGRLSEILPNLKPSLQEIGFSDAFADKEGLVSGKLNRVLLKRGSNSEDSAQ
ncbi:ATP-dependent sacrificial sulfur transferase LarE [Marinilabilia sp.]|uniref:ATP-dependent sacrificial sulfur transferase LarE n=1 Tax=Marinilabilia sp. TaxID=2021252 RepID=UPI0025BE593A|nr:ATP-dependent sacrificial sulfur transferase LarE [Marinilabilia sp.]